MRDAKQPCPTSKLRRLLAWAPRTMDLRMAVGLASCTLVGCETAQPPATDQEVNQANYSFLECVRNNTGRMDDGISDAYVIATAIVQGPCFLEAEYVVETHTRGSNDRVKEMFRDNFYNKSSKDVALEIVLLERTK
jgi:hypothetical protein